jgi:hypothetical protein
MSAEVAFVGGPADGLVREYPGETPPELIEVLEPGPRGFETLAVPVRYETRPSPLADGPLWIAVPLEAER